MLSPLRLPVLGALSFAMLSSTLASAAPVRSFGVRGDQFVLDGQPFVVRSGEMHYPRVPREQWRQRMRMARAMGLNTLCTYVFWNLHEPTPGKFDFTGNLDLAEYIRNAGQEGLLVIVRPGPYICTELDFGGFPAWLLKDPKLVVRSQDPKFLAYTERYLKKVGAVVRPLTVQRGGPVIMAQVENEYGSYGSDHVYMAWVRDAMKRAGFDCLLITSDGPSQGMLRGGTLPDLVPTINFGGGAERAFAELAKFRPGTPRMIGEYWCGWFDHWGKRHHRTNIQNHVRDLEWCLANGVSFNLYMFHGGTNFAFMQGSNGGANDYNVDTTSHDYDAPLDESGRPTEKYSAFRDAIRRHLPADLPQVPETAPAIAIPAVDLTESAPLLGPLPRAVVNDTPKTFEEPDQAFGLVLYRTSTKLAGSQILKVDKLGDYATVFVNGSRVGTLDRRRGQRTIELDLPRGGATIDLLVESLSRVNFGSAIPTERKGLAGPVTLGTETLGGWRHYRFPLSDLQRLRFVRQTSGGGPCFYRGVLRVDTPGDSFLDLRGWNKGFVWVNGRNLGRFWSIGPQQTLFVPGVWLKKGGNEVIVYDEGPQVERPRIQGLPAPILDEVKVDYSLLHRKPGQTLDLAGVKPVHSGSFASGAPSQEIPFSGIVRGRYFCIEALSEQGGNAYAAIAEIHLIGPDGKELPRKAWKVLYADSEEVGGENGSAANVIDNQPTTHWHTRWSGTPEPFPHSLVIDLGAEVEVSALRYLPRQGGENGRIGDFRVYVRREPFKGL